jgi:hypothetical protein
MIYYNFLQWNNTQNMIWSSLWQRSSSKYSKDIYFVFFLALIYFLCILEVCNKFWNYKWKKWKPTHSAGLAFAPWPRTTGLCTDKTGPRLLARGAGATLWAWSSHSARVHRRRDDGSVTFPSSQRETGGFGGSVGQYLGAWGSPRHRVGEGTLTWTGTTVFFLATVLRWLEVAETRS